MSTSQMRKKILDETMDKIKLNKMLKKYEQLWLEIENAISSQKALVIAIDGHSTSGKSTLADLICMLYDANVFHMDDFFRSQLQEKSSFIYASNIDFARLEAEIIMPLAKKQNIDYKAFDCKTQSFMPITQKPYKLINVIEGAYSQHPQIANIIDLRIFLKSTYLQQVRRVIKRNGYKDLIQFLKKWIPNERKYFKHFKIKQHAHYVFKSLHY